VLAHSAKEALAKLEGVDGVVTDYSMPDMDGVQLSRRSMNATTRSRW